uniref:Sushi domain-containing protein n=1 Tax=Naja naja TaxID=35670 RepID=A0A8C6X762_NAJNA
FIKNQLIFLHLLRTSQGFGTDKCSLRNEGNNMLFVCDMGYSPANQQSTVTCTKNGWSPLKLPDLKLLIDFGEIVSTEKAKYLENDRVQYRCNPSYVLEGPEWIQCKGQEWTPHPPKCLGQSCGDPPRIENGDIVPLSEQQYRSGSSVEFRCQKYYAMEGQNRSFCNNGAWTKLPVCLGKQK